MDAQSPLQVGIVGCGYQGGILAQTVVRGNVWRIVACADPDQAAAAHCRDCRWCGGVRVRVGGGAVAVHGCGCCLRRDLA